MGDITPGWAAIAGVLLALLWMLAGAGMVALWRRDLSEETFTAYFNMLCWPLGAVAQWVVYPLVRRRKERARQARITAAVDAGTYTAEWARQSLRWKG